MVSTFEESIKLFIQETGGEIHDSRGKCSIARFVIFPEFFDQIPIAGNGDKVVELPFDYPMGALHIALEGFGTGRDSVMPGLSASGRHLGKEGFFQGIAGIDELRAVVGLYALVSLGLDTIVDILASNGPCR